MSHFFNDPERKPVETGHSIEKGAREAPEEAKMSFERDEEEASSPLSLDNSTFSGSSTGSGDMTQDEVSKLVHNALRRARQATTPKSSPRASPRGSRISKSPRPSPPASTKSTKSVSSADNLKSFDSMEASYHKHNIKEDPHAAALLSSVPLPIKEPPKIRLSIKTSFEGDLPPTKDKKSVSSPSTDMVHSPAVDASDVVPRSRERNRSSSNDVIRRVEEEIANAKKAAEEAQQRLAYALSSRSSNSWSIDEPASSQSMGLAEMLDQGGASYDDHDMRGILSVSSGEDLDEAEKFTEVTDTSFVIAREMISEEFNNGSQEVKESEKFDHVIKEEPNEEGEEEPPAAAGKEHEKVDDVKKEEPNEEGEEEPLPAAGKEHEKVDDVKKEEPNEEGKEEPPAAAVKEYEKVDNVRKEEPKEEGEEETPAAADDTAAADDSDPSTVEVDKQEAPAAKDSENPAVQVDGGESQLEQKESLMATDSSESPTKNVKFSAPSEDSDFLGTIDETILGALGKKEPAEASGIDNTNESAGTPGDENVDSEPDVSESKVQDLGATSSETESSLEKSDEIAPVEEKKEDSPLSGPWNGFLSTLMGSSAPDNVNDCDDEAENPAKVVRESDSDDSQEYLTPKSKDAMDGERTSDDTDDASTSEAVENGADMTGQKSKPALKTPWWTSPDVPVTNVDAAERSEEEVAKAEDTAKEKDEEAINLVSEDRNEEASEINSGETGGEPNDLASRNAKEANEKGNSQNIEAAEIGGVSSDKPKSSSQTNNSTTPDKGPDSVANAKPESEKASQLRKLLFKEPYPTPQPLAIPRPPEDIIKDNQEPIPERIVRWTNPKPQLQDLLLAAEGDSLARRSNALGALKVLSLKKKNQLTLARTRGFLDSVVHAANASFPFEDEELGLTARARAVVTLLHVSEPKDNRNIVFRHPGLPEALVKVIEEDHGEARAHACGALAMLAKTVSNREPMVKVERLIDALSLVVKGTKKKPIFVETEMETEVLEDEEDVEIEENSHDGSESSGSSSDDSAAHSDDGSTGSSYSESSTKPVEKVEEINEEVAKNDSIKMQKESMIDEFVTCARYNACAALLHLSKHCAISHVLCENETFLESMMAVSVEFDNRIHTKCLEILCNVTRFPSNHTKLARNSALVDTFVTCGKSNYPQDRVWSMRAMQNIASDSSSKLILATSPILTLLSICAVRNDYDEQVAAVATLYNLSTDAGAVVPLTNTKNVVATLVHLAHDSNSSPDVRQMACDALATIGLWLQTLASAGTAPKGLEDVPLPTHATAGWDRWD